MTAKRYEYESVRRGRNQTWGPVLCLHVFCVILGICLELHAGEIEFHLGSTKRRYVIFCKPCLHLFLKSLRKIGKHMDKKDVTGDACPKMCQGLQEKKAKEMA